MGRLYLATIFLSSVVFPAVAGETPSPAQAAAENGLIPAGAAAGSPKYSIEARMAFYHVPGVSLAVIDGGRIAFVKGYGVIEVGKPAPVTPETRFQAASISKPVGALGVLALVEKGALSLDAAVNTELQTWKLPDNEFTQKTPVTLRLLLSHSAGTNAHGFAGYPAGARLPTLNQILDGQRPANSAAVRVTDPPAMRVNYSGGGLTVVQKLVEDVTGKFFADYMAMAVLQPLGMTQSTYQVIQPQQPNPEFATAHLADGQPYPGRWHRYPESMAAGLWTTPGDLARFVIELQQSLAGTGNHVLTRKMTVEMLTPQKEDAGLAIFLAGAGQARSFVHDGANAGFRSLCVGFTERGQGMVVMVNSDAGGELMPEIMQSVARAYAWPGYRAPAN